MAGKFMAGLYISNDRTAALIAFWARFKRMIAADASAGNNEKRPRR
jgi:hypothetical protein